ncbi:ninjurin-2-like [Babylonia areolata]|uniref:ninjurin-2-like n=1 Tax=Babylonia areolata TaxID=304850 RepID=UPI003FD31808
MADGQAMIDGGNGGIPPPVQNNGVAVEVEDAEAGEATPLVPKPNYPPTPGYATRKTIAQGALLVALMMANASQLTALLDARDDRKARYFVCLLVLLGLSLFTQLVTAVLLIVVGITRPDTAQAHHRVTRLNTVTVCIAFLITILNVFITAFGITYVHEENSHTTPTPTP